MEIVFPKPGSYVIAVSGGVDSVALLHLLAERTELNLTVAHLDHGIRQQSASDAGFVSQLAAGYGFPFASKRVELGPNASEATARQVRYDFLEEARNDNGAHAIITAHHLNDVVETAVINILRGGGRKALTSLKSRGGVLRPLLKVSKKEILQYAKAEKLDWREDATNEDTKYLRNHVRAQILPQFSDVQLGELIDLIDQQKDVNSSIDTLLVKYIHDREDLTLDRVFFNQLPHDVATEFLAEWLRQQEVRDFDKATINRLVIAAKTAHAGRQIDVGNHRKMQVDKTLLCLV
jgi:tRNA(Ile)-lysidine synthase